MMSNDIDTFMHAISSQESSHNPNATNSRSGAHGQWQIMPSNWSPWAKEAGLSANAPQTAENQRQVARNKMQQYHDQFGSWDAVAVAWFAGPGRARRYLDGDRSVLQMSDGNMKVGEYVDKMNRGMGSAPARGGAGERQPQGGADTVDQYDDSNEPPPVDSNEMWQTILSSLADQSAGGSRLPLDVAAPDLEPLPAGVDDGRGFQRLAGRMTGESAERAVNGALARWQTMEAPRPIADVEFPESIPEGAQPGQPTPQRGGDGGGPGGELVEAAKRYIGVDYLWGGTDPDKGLDCSGLLQLAAREVGIDIPRVSRDQARAGVDAGMDPSGWTPGDLIAFDGAGSDGVVNHIGMLVGRGDNGEWLMLHAPRTGKQVEVVPMKRDDVLAVRRVTGGSQ